MICGPAMTSSPISYGAASYPASVTMRTSVSKTGTPTDIAPVRESTGGVPLCGVIWVGDVASVRPYIGWMRVPVLSYQSDSTPGGVGAPPVYTFVNDDKSYLPIASLLSRAMNAVTAETVNVARWISVRRQASSTSNR